MHICILQHVFDSFKGANHLPLYRANADCQFTIVCSASKVVESDLPSNVQVVTVPGRIGPYYYGVRDYLFAKLILKRYPLRDSFWNSFDVIHLNQIMGPALRKLAKLKAPLLLTIHHPVTADLEVSVQESGVISGLHWRMKYALLVYWQRAMCRVCDQVITVSHTVRDRLISDYGCDASRITIVPNGVDGEVFTIGTDVNQYDVVAMGSFIHPRKGFPYLLKVYQAFSDAGLQIADIGRRSDEQRSALSEISGVTTFNTIPGAELIDVLQRSAALISVSLYEGFGLSLIEALSCGKPAFAFGGGAVQEVLDPIDTNLTVPLRDVQELTSRVTTFLELSEEERMHKGAQYRERVLAHYSIEHSARALLATYAQIIS